jgi:hypothetical protein
VARARVGVGDFGLFGELALASLLAIGVLRRKVSSARLALGAGRECATTCASTPGRPLQGRHGGNQGRTLAKARTRTSTARPKQPRSAFNIPLVGWLSLGIAVSVEWNEGMRILTASVATMLVFAGLLRWLTRGTGISPTGDASSAASEDGPPILRPRFPAEDDGPCLTALSVLRIATREQIIDCAVCDPADVVVWLRDAERRGLVRRSNKDGSAWTITDAGTQRLAERWAHDVVADP